MHMNAYGNLVSLSEDKKEPLREWTVTSVADLGKRLGSCSCGTSIRYLFRITNEKNLNTLTLGSTCIKSVTDESWVLDVITFWLEMEAGTRHQISHHYAKDTKRLHLLDDFEFKFLLSVGQKRKLYGKQTETLDRIKEHVIDRIKCGGYKMWSDL